ncbi:hypothetical protein Tco_1210688 [Tanacetum coccineum]
MYSSPYCFHFFFLPIDMPLDSPKPPGPILVEFCTLTRMTSEGIHHKSFVPAGDSLPPKPCGRLKGVRNHFKGRSRSDSSPDDVICGKHSNSSSIYVDDVLIKVLDRIAYVMSPVVNISYSSSNKLSRFERSSELFSLFSFACVEVFASSLVILLILPSLLPLLTSEQMESSCGSFNISDRFDMNPQDLLKSPYCLAAYTAFIPYDIEGKTLFFLKGLFQEPFENDPIIMTSSFELVFLICRKFIRCGLEVRAGCCLEADASDSPWFSTNLPLLLFNTEYFSIKSAVCRSRILRRASSSFVPRYLSTTGEMWVINCSSVLIGGGVTSDEGLVRISPDFLRWFVIKKLIPKVISVIEIFHGRHRTRMTFWIIFDDMFGLVYFRKRTMAFPEFDLVWSSYIGSGSGPARASCTFSGSDPAWPYEQRLLFHFQLVLESEVDEDSWISFSDVSSSGEDMELLVFCDNAFHCLSLQQFVSAFKVLDPDRYSSIQLVVVSGLLGGACFVAVARSHFLWGSSLYSQQPFPDTWVNTRIVDWLQTGCLGLFTADVFPVIALVVVYWFLNCFHDGVTQSDVAGMTELDSRFLFEWGNILFLLLRILQRGINKKRQTLQRNDLLERTLALFKFMSFRLHLKTDGNSDLIEFYI